MQNKPPLSFRNIINTIAIETLKEKVVWDYNTYCKVKHGHALLYYKTDPFTPFYKPSYLHTNQWEILAIARTLNELGFWVDIIDRNAKPPFHLKDRYQVFIGSSSTDSTRFFPEIAQQIPSAVKIFYATSTHPLDHNKRIKHRYKIFQERTGYRLPPQRLTTAVDMTKICQTANYIFSVGNKITNETYEKCGLPIYSVHLSTSPKVRFTRESVIKKGPHKFIFFAGSGNIIKGLDIALEVFSRTPQLELHVCTKVDKEFYNLYKPLLSQSPNIYLHGFVDVGSKLFQKLTDTCAFVFSPSCTEGMSTSVLTCMRKGCIPIATPETGVNLNEFGIYFKDINISKVQEIIQKASNLSQTELHERVLATHNSSQKYTQEQFYNSIFQNLTKILLENQLF